MSQYIIAYLGRPQPESPEQAKAQMGNWQSWVKGLGDAAVNPGTPLKDGAIVAPDGAARPAEEEKTISGFTVVEADSKEAALEMARACPYGEIGGELLVAEMMQMPS